MSRVIRKPDFGVCGSKGEVQLLVLSLFYLNTNFKSLAYWVIFHAFLSSADFFQNKLFEKILSGIPSECQTVWTLIRPDDSSGLIWVQTVCQGYQQTTLVDKELNLLPHPGLYQIWSEIPKTGYVIRWLKYSFYHRATFSHEIASEVFLIMSFFVF